MTNKKIPIFGLLLVAVGFLLVLNTLNIFYFTFGDFIRFIVPVGFIVLGIWLIIRKKRQEQVYQTEANYQHYANEQARSVHTESPLAGATPPPPPPPPGGAYTSGQTASFSHPSLQETGSLKYSKSFGDMFIDGNNISLQNILVSMGVGDIEIKLHGGILKSGLNRIVVTGFVGDIRIMVPPDMPVYVHSSCLVGDIELFGSKTSGFSNDLDGQTANYNAAENKLYIAINHFIGDIRVIIV
ncbi:MAG: cell wall-active antibiotics response protein LiaF [Candidatus Zixiibacteriota bacterium]